MVFADETSIYVFDPVINSTIKTLVHGLTNPSSLAVDPKRKYIFVSDNDLDGNTGQVIRYLIKVNVTNATHPDV